MEYCTASCATQARIDILSVSSPFFFGCRDTAAEAALLAGPRVRHGEGTAYLGFAV